MKSKKKGDYVGESCSIVRVLWMVLDLYRATAGWTFKETD